MIYSPWHYIRAFCHFLGCDILSKEIMQSTIDNVLPNPIKNAQLKIDSIVQLSFKHSKIIFLFDIQHFRIHS